MAAIDGKILLTHNPCYKTYQKMTPKGIVVHSTGANNPYIKRYVAPDDGVIGKNDYGNDWNRSSTEVCVHGFIGKDKNNKVKFYQTLPFDICCWGVGGGWKGSYNYNPAYIQFEMCEDGLNDKAYCKACYDKAVEVCAYLCKKYGISVSNIVSHHEAYLKGYGSNHGDPHNWWDRFGYTMDGFRKAVKAKMKTTTKVKTKRKCNLYNKDYKDPVGKTSGSISVPKGTELVWVSDDKYGWSKVKFHNVTYWIINSNLNKSKLSSCPTMKMSKSVKGKKVKNGKFVAEKTIKKGETVKDICVIESGKYAGYSYIKRVKYGTYYYVKL